MCVVERERERKRERARVEREHWKCNSKSLYAKSLWKHKVYVK